MAGGTVVRPCRAGARQLLALHAADPSQFPHLLVSGGSGGRFDVLFASPDPPRLLPPDASPAQTAAFFADIERRIGEPEPSVDALPFTRGDFVYFGYELAGRFEPRLDLPAPSLPLAFAQYCHAAIVHDRARQKTVVCAQSEGLARTLAARVEGAGGLAPAAFTLRGIEEEDPARYVSGIARIQDYIRAGDVFQVNLSRGYAAEVPEGLTPAQIMAALTTANPAPFAALATLGEAAIISASPERLVEVRGRTIRTCPIAGTAPRLAGEDDAAVCRELRSHPKERAEHIMLVDLERNDIGRICMPGTVRVPSLMRVESYATVHHLVSTVEGTLRTDASLYGILRSLFPGGSITGCPKVRCMEILAQLEGRPREAYTGSLGYINQQGDMELNILIRTAVLHAGNLVWRVGGGIVADSDPGRELAETRAKAAGLLQAFGA
ncbi:MAG: chorismate-binding protein [Gammaproteobacteria bacterium]|nr:chorismate-binding protein [Gammaproteobacteria bacterium]